MKTQGIITIDPWSVRTRIVTFFAILPILGGRHIIISMVIGVAFGIWTWKAETTR